jgi:hypothetical protein
MASVKLVCFEGCPNAEKAKGLLRKIGVPFDEIRQDDLQALDRYRGYTSPTILNGDKIVIGSSTEGAAGGCSIDIPSAEELRTRLNIGQLTSTNQKRRGTTLSLLGSVFSAVTVGLCPVCIPAIGAFLSAIGLGFLVQEAVLKPVLVIFLGIAVFGFLWSYLKEHRHVGPLVIGTIMAVVIYVSRYVYFGADVNTALMYGSIGGIIATSVWNIQLKKKMECCACNASGLEYK